MQEENKLKAFDEEKLFSSPVNSLEKLTIYSEHSLVNHSLNCDMVKRLCKQLNFLG